MFDLPPALLHFIWVIPLVLLALYVGSPRFRGTSGQVRTRRLLSAQLQKNQYTVLNGLTLPAGGGTMHLDHLVVSQFGIFVIATVSRSGKISGTEFQDRWKHYHFGRIHRFDNPMHLNYQAINALAQLLQLSPALFHSIVVFSGSGSFANQMPANVIPAQKLIPLIRKFSRKILTPEDANRVLRQVKEDSLSSRTRFRLDRWTLLRFALVLVLIAGGWLAFRVELTEAYRLLQNQLEKTSQPEMFHADGRRKTEQELWESSLRCIYSNDTGKCVCIERDGSSAELEPGKCQSLSEQGSILQQ